MRRWLLPLVFACLAAGSARPEVDFSLRSIGEEFDNVTVTAVFSVRAPDGKVYFVKCLPGEYINGTGGWKLKDIRDPQDATFHRYAIVALGTTERRMDWPNLGRGKIAWRMEQQRLAKLADRRANATWLDKVYGDDDVRDGWLMLGEKAMADRQRERDALVRPTSRPATQPTSRPS